MRRISIGTIVLCASLLIAGCERDEEITLVFAHWNAPQQEAMEAVARAFEEENPGITVEVQLTPWREYWTKLEAAFISDKAPDTFALHTNFAEHYARSGVVMELDDLDEYDPEFSFGNYPEGITALYTFDGRHYAVPKDVDCVVLAYNTALFDRAGISYPDGSWTWEDLVAAADAIAALGEDVYGFGAYQNPQEGWGNFIYQNGGYVISADGSRSGMAMSESIEAMRFYTDMFLNSDRSPSTEVFAETDRRIMFAQGTIGMLPVGNWQLSHFYENEEIRDSFDIAPLPRGRHAATIMNGLGWAGAASTEHPEEVKRLIAFMGSERGNTIAAAGPAIPAYRGVAERWVDLHEDLYTAEVVLESLEHGIQYGGSLEKPQWEPIMFDYVDRIFLGQIGVEEGMAAIGREMDEIIGD